MNTDIIKLFIDQTQDEKSLKQLQYEIINYFQETPVNIIITNLETLIEFLYQVKKKIITITILYNEELENIIENLEEFYIYLKNIYTKQEKNIKQSLYSDENDMETNEEMMESLKSILYNNILLEQDTDTEESEKDEELDDTDNNDIHNMIITPHDIPDEEEDNEEDDEDDMNDYQEEEDKENEQEKEMIYYELMITDLLQYDFNLEYIKQFITDLTDLISLVIKLEQQDIEILNL